MVRRADMVSVQCAVPVQIVPVSWSMTSPRAMVFRRAMVPRRPCNGLPPCNVPAPCVPVKWLHRAMATLTYIFVPRSPTHITSHHFLLRLVIRNFSSLAACTSLVPDTS